VLVTFRPQADKSRARKSESNYEDSIEAYRETPAYKIPLKREKKLQVRKQKKALRGANKSLRSHYYVRLPGLNERDVLDDEIVYRTRNPLPMYRAQVKSGGTTVPTMPCLHQD